MDKARSAMQQSRVRIASAIGVVGLASLAALTPGCADSFDTTRTPPPRGTVGEEMFGVICDRVGAQALREDLTGASFHDICHRPNGGDFANTVDVTKLPDTGDPDVRPKAIARIEALGRRRDDLIRALDATFPGDEKIAIKDIDNADETHSCDAPAQSGEGYLTTEIADMLGRMGNLYDDGTIPQSTESLASVVDAFRQSDEAQAAWARLSARQGYRPIDTALGAARPLVAYPRLRDLANASLSLLSADSQPYQVNPQYDANGNRVPVPGPGNAALNALLEAGHEEMLAATTDPPAALLAVTIDAATGRTILTRPRDNLEIFQTLLYTSDPAFGSGTSNFIVRRDPRGYAAIAGGAVPAPFVDADHDGLPDVDDVGRFITTDKSVAPSPFPFPGAATTSRDQFGRALAGSQLLYDYLDTTHTFAAQLLTDLKPLVNPSPDAKHETLMDMAGGLWVAVGPRAQTTKAYADKSITYNGISTKDSPLLDLVYAMGVILSDKSADTTLALAHDLVANHTQDVARVSGAMIDAFDIAQKHPEAKIPPTATFWDEQLDVLVQVAKEPGLLEDMLRALGDPASAQLGQIMASYAKYKDQISYDRANINGPPWNVTLNSGSEMSTPVDRGMPETGDNRSALYRFLSLINDTTGVTACNKPDAVVHAKAFGLSVTMPIGGGTYSECEVFKIDNLAAFYLDAIANAQQYDPSSKANKRGTFYLRNDTLRNGILGIGAATVQLMEDSSGLTGFWTDSGSKTLAAKPEWLNRLVFFDLQHDTQNDMTKTFIADLQGLHMGTSVCPERTIPDPNPGAPDASSDGIVHGLRNCPDGEWLDQRGKNTIFTWENFGFYDAIRPLLSAFVKHNREDLFLALSNATYKHMGGAEASKEECKLAGGAPCPRDGMDSYEPLITEAFATDVLPAISQIAKTLDTLSLKRCDAVDPTTKKCTKPETISGIDAVAAATRAALDPDYAKQNGLKDRRGGVTAKRNDGSTNPQVTPAYLLTEALAGIDGAFDAYEKAHPEDKDRRANWRRARSQLVDQFLGVSGAGPTATFKDAAIPKIAPILVDVLRAQLLAHCPTPGQTCDWAKTDLTQHATDTVGGPLMAAALDVVEAIRADANGRQELEAATQYLLDAASKNDALASILASTTDIVQVLRDDKNLVPLLHVLAAAMDKSTTDDSGNVKKSLVDAQMALLAKISGKYFDANNNEICHREVDPNQVLPVALGHLVTPINDGSFKGQTPLEVIIDVIADVNRVDPSQKYDGTLERTDYKSVSDNVVDFLTNDQHGLEQFYEVIRQGTQK